MCRLQPLHRGRFLSSYSKYRSKFHHILLIDEEVRSGSFPNSKAIARKLELSDRTIRRNIEFMRDVLGAPIEYNASKKGYHYAEPGWSLPGIQLTEGELLGLVLTQMALNAYKGTPLESYLKRIVDKLLARLPEQVAIDPGDLVDTFRITLGPVAPINPQHWELLAQALREKRTVRMTYYSVGKDRVTEREVDPYLLRCYRGDWYLIGHDHHSTYVPVFSVSRIRKLELLDRHFEVRDDFEPDEYLRGMFQTFQTTERHKVKIQFFDIAARIVAERQWHPTQKITHRKEGSIILEMTVADLDEVAWWVLSWGSRAKVLSPTPLRTLVAEELSKAQHLYEPRKREKQNT